jgi:hypothetical protein
VLAAGERIGDSTGHCQLAGAVFVIGMVAGNQSLAPEDFFHDLLPRNGTTSSLLRR